MLYKKKKKFDNIKRNALYEKIWKNEICDNIKRNALYKEI